MTGMSNDALIVQLVEWIGQEPRSYAETIDAWRTSCPRLTVWEDALSAGLIERVPAASGQRRFASRRPGKPASRRANGLMREPERPGAADRRTRAGAPARAGA
jgi:hypothetical protein